MDEELARYREDLERLRFTPESKAALASALARHRDTARPTRRSRPWLTVAAAVAACLALTAGGWIELTGLTIYRVDYYDPRFTNIFYTIYTNGVVWFLEVSPLGWGCIGLILLFAAQLALCLRARRWWTRCLPLLVVLLGLLCSAATYLGLFGRYSAGDISGNQLVGLILAMITGIAGLGVAAAWGVYGIVRLWRRRGR